MSVMREDVYLHHAAVKKNVSREGNFVCNVLTNTPNILTPAVFMATPTLPQTRLGEDLFKLIGKSLNFCGFLTHCIAYRGTDIRHGQTILQIIELPTRCLPRLAQPTPTIENAQLAMPRYCSRRDPCAEGYTYQYVLRHSELCLAHGL
jgi:hypothetical protein